MPLLKTYRLAYLVVLIYVLMHNIETVKKLDFNQYVVLDQWPRDNTSVCVASGSVFDIRV